MGTVRNLSSKPQRWLEFNLWSLALGVLISSVVTICVWVTVGRPSLEGVFISLMFGLVIGFCIANCIYLISVFSKRKGGHGLAFLLAYYGLALLGMGVGIELSYWLVSQFFGTSYRFFHPEDWQVNGIIVLIITTIIYGYFSMKERQKAVLQRKEMDIIRIGKLKTEADLAALQSKINPHFLYNALNSIASLIPSDPVKAEAMTLKLSTLFRQSINREQGHWGTVASEISLVNAYIDIERIRFGNRIEFSVVVETGLESVLIPRFLIQPLAENALKHGLKDVTADGILDVTLQRQGDRLLIAIADNGQPFPQEVCVGYGLQGTYDKLQLLYGDDYQLALVNTPSKQLTINIPIKT